MSSFIFYYTGNVSRHNSVRVVKIINSMILCCMKYTGTSPRAQFGVMSMMSCYTMYLLHVLTCIYTKFCMYCNYNPQVNNFVCTVCCLLPSNQDFKYQVDKRVIVSVRVGQWVQKAFVLYLLNMYNSQVRVVNVWLFFLLQMIATWM